LDPVDELTRIGAIHSEVLQPCEVRLDTYQDRFGAVATLDISGADRPRRSNSMVSTRMCRLCPLTFFPIYPMGATHLGRLRALAIDAARTGQRMIAKRCAELDAQRLVKTLRRWRVGEWSCCYLR
jgi:hypothetical protein